MSQSSLCAALPFKSNLLFLCKVADLAEALLCPSLQCCYALGCNADVPWDVALLLCPGMLHCYSVLGYTVAVPWAAMLLCPGMLHCCTVVILLQCHGMHYIVAMSWVTALLLCPGLHSSGFSLGNHLSHPHCGIRALLYTCCAFD